MYLYSAVYMYTVHSTQSPMPDGKQLMNRAN